MLREHNKKATTCGNTGYGKLLIGEELREATPVQTNSKANTTSSEKDTGVVEFGAGLKFVASITDNEAEDVSSMKAVWLLVLLSSIAAELFFAD